MGPIRISRDGGFPATSPFFDGHFDGNPIVPGAVLLGLLAGGVRAQGWRIARVQRMKFVRPLAPATPFEATVSPRGQAARAEFRDGQGTFAVASLVLGPADD